MNHRVLVWLVSGCLLCCFGCSVKVSQGSASSPSASPASASQSPSASATPAADSAWKEFKAQDGSFTVLFPGEPKVNITDKGKFKLNHCVAEAADGTKYTVLVTEIPELSPTFPPPAGVFKDALESVTQTYGPTAKVDSQKDMTIAGCPGIEYVVSFESNGKPVTLNIRSLVAHDGHQIFNLVAGGTGRAESVKFFESFQLGKYTPPSSSEGSNNN